MVRTVQFLKECAALLRTSGPRAALRLARSRIYSTTDTLLYEYRGTGAPHTLPGGWSLHVVRSESDPGLDLLRRSGGDFTPESFLRGAVAYVICIDGEPVGHRYDFPGSPLARRLGPDATYFGNAFVRPEWRGLGVNGHLLRAMAGAQPPGRRILIAVAHTNATNQRSLRKNGALLLGRLRTTVFLARVVRARIDPLED